MKHTLRRAEFNAQIRHRIRIVMAVNKINVKELAKDAKLSYPTMNMVLCSPVVEPKLSYLARIAEALGFDLDALVGRQSLFVRQLGKAVMEMA